MGLNDKCLIHGNSHPEYLCKQHYSASRIFLISPVAGTSAEDIEAVKQRHPDLIKSMELKKIYSYVENLENSGNGVHWPLRDTKQDDPTGGFKVCKDNFSAIFWSDEIHIWYNETSGGSKFDMGGVFMLAEMMGFKKKIIIVNEDEIKDESKKSLFKVFKHLIALRK